MPGRRLTRWLVGSSVALVAASVACGRSYEAGEVPAVGADGSAGGADGSADASALGSDAGADADDAAGMNLDGGADPMLDRYRVFVTSTKVGGGFSGRAAADAKCNLLASGKNLRGAYRAWLSTSTVDAYGRITGNGPWYRMDGTTLVFTSRTSLKTGPVAAPLADENGAEHPGNATIWTGTSATGTATSATCDDWVSTTVSATGTVGRADLAGAGWASSGELACDLTARLLCLRAF